MQMKSINRLALAGVLAGVLVQGRAETLNGDITAAVREAGLTPVITAPAPNGTTPTGGDGTLLFDGVLQRSDEVYAYPESGQRYYIKTSKLPVTITYDVPDGFVPGRGVVAKSITFGVGMANSAGTKSFSITGNTDRERLPSAWTVEGSNDGTTWEPLDSVVDFTDCSEPSYGDYPDAVLKKREFYNTRSFRSYRITITAVSGATDFLQLTEIRLGGEYGGDPVGPEPQRIDVTAAVRSTGDARTLDTNLTQFGTDYGVEKAFNGSISSDNLHERYIVTAASTATALANGGAYVTYAINDDFLPGGDVVVNGYSLFTSCGWDAALYRLPASWKFQGYDTQTGEWVTLDEYEGFRYWEKRTIGDSDFYCFDFRFRNSAAYRKYRILITKFHWELFPGSIADSKKMLQLSQIQLWGYADRDIAGKVGSEIEDYPIDLTAFAQTVDAYKHSFMTPTISNSTATTVIGNVQNLFNGLLDDRYLGTIGDNFPFDLHYEIPADTLTGKDIVLTNYAMWVKTGWESTTARLPLSWQLEGYADDRWIALDKQTGFTAWSEQPIPGTEDGTAKVADFALTDNHLAFRRYRLRIKSVGGLSKGGLLQLQLGEIQLRGIWGSGIGGPVPERKGLILLFR